MHSRRLVLAVLTLAAMIDAAAAPPAPPPPCTERAESRQFDFWLGRWDVTDHGKVIATSVIEKHADGCIVLENYTQLDGYSGKSINFYDNTLRRWRQTWADSRGNASEFVGDAQGQSMVFDGETHPVLNGGTKVLRKMTIALQPDGTVRQSSERSLDGGATWAPGYDFTYVKKPS